MSVDFFRVPCANLAGNCTTYPHLCLTNISNPQFGITDETGGENTPARVDVANSAIWDLVVINNSGVDVTFKAVDWCVPVFRTGTYILEDENRKEYQFSSENTGIGGNWIKRCEGFLYYDNKILFIEIKRKNKRPSEWIKDAREKFEETILSFREHHPHLANQIIKPLIVNRKYTGLATAEMVQKRILKDKIGIEFIRETRITI
jgi:hypothetical protein